MKKTLSFFVSMVVFVCVLLAPPAASAVTFQAGTYKYTTDTIAPFKIPLLEQAKNIFSLQPLLAPGINAPEANLGFGWSTDQDMPTIMCAASDPYSTTVYGGSSEGLIDVARSYSLSEVKDQLHLSTDTDVDVGIFSADISADFVRNLESDNYSEAFIYRTWIKLKNSIYTPTSDIPAYGNYLSPIANIYKSNPDLFRQVCGDKYASQMEWGGYLYVAVKFIFNSTQDLQSFNASMSGSFGDIFQMSAHFAQASSQINKNGAIKIQALQIGGDPTQLGKIIGGSGGQAPIIYCTFDNLGQCQQMLNNIITYATSSTDNNFPTQITIGSPTTPISAAQTGIDLLDYMYLGVIIQPDSKVTPEIKAARSNLATALEGIKANEDRVNFLIGRFSYQPDYISKLQDTLSILQQNEKAVTDAGMNCFTYDATTHDLSTCVDTAQSTLANLKPFNANLLQQPFEQYVHVVLNNTNEQAIWGAQMDCTNPKVTIPACHWTTPNPTTTIDLKSGGIARSDFSTFAGGSDRLAIIPSCQDTSVALTGNYYNSDSMLWTGHFFTNMIKNGTAAIQQLPTCENNYVTVFGGLDQGSQSSPPNPYRGPTYWHDNYDFWYRVMHYYE